MVRYSPFLLSSNQKAAESARPPLPVHSTKWKYTLNHVICHYSGLSRAELGGTFVDFGVSHRDSSRGCAWKKMRYGTAGDGMKLSGSRAAEPAVMRKSKPR